MNLKAAENLNYGDWIASGAAWLAMGAFIVVNGSMALGRIGLLSFIACCVSLTVIYGWALWVPGRSEPYAVQRTGGRP